MPYGGIWLELLPLKRKRRLSDVCPPRPEYAPHSLHRFRRQCEERELDRSLCTQCQRIDFEAIFDIQPTELVTNEGVAVFNLDQLPAFTQDIECRLCKLFALIVDRNQEYDKNNAPEWQKSWHLRAFTTGTLWNKSHGEISRANKSSIVIALARGSSSFLHNADSKIDCIDRGVILPHRNSLGSQSKYSVPCQIAKCPRRVQFDLIKAALSGCHRNHSICKEQQEQLMKFPIEAKVIDCRSRKVVSLKPEMIYIALSYVWGPGKKIDPSCLPDKNGVLPRQLPLTIEDAIRVARGLGFRYLWADRYCIDQEQSKSKQKQITQMANIYSNAVVTICALGGDDGTAIAGISSDRKKQLYIELQNVALSWTGPSVRRRLQSSKWSTRGWTYQELVLSRRCVFFTDYYAALVCDKENWTENILFSNFESLSFDKDSGLLRDASNLGQVLHPPQKFYMHVQEYQNRHLTYATDSLHAFKGILSQLSVQSYWGIPIYDISPLTKKQSIKTLEKKREAGFIAGMCWKSEDQSSSEAQIREAFPSWSWVGSRCTSLLKNCLAGSMQFEVSPSHFATFQASISIKSKSDKVVSIESVSRICANIKIIPEQTQYLEITSIMVQWYTSLDAQEREGLGKDHMVAYRLGNNDWWQSNNLGYLYLDPCTDDRTGGSAKVDQEDDAAGSQMTQRKILQRGPAVLLALEEVPPLPGKTRTLVRATWLVVVKAEDGTFRRKGIIVSNGTDKNQPPIGPPTQGLRTIVLG